MPSLILDEDLVRVRGNRFDRYTGKVKPGVVRMLYWGDEVEIVDLAENEDPTVRDVRVHVHNYGLRRSQEGTIRKSRGRPIRFREGPNPHLLEVTFLDVQQGDACFVLTPDRKLLVVDGGEGKFLARFLASRFPNTTTQAPLEIAALIVTHGDADHFSGLFELAAASRYADSDHRQIFSRVNRYFHNGLVKGPAGGKFHERFGAAIKKPGIYYATDLWMDPRSATYKNDSFKNWDRALQTLLSDGGVTARLKYGDDGAFDFLRPGIDVEVLGPVEESINGEPALRFFGRSDSHTINGHSVVLRLRHGNVHFLLGGDLNTEAEEHLRKHIASDTSKTLRSEVFKVPHHGSHDFTQGFLNLVNPVVSVVSSGDENVSKEYVHPRANLMAGLGLASRGPVPLVFSTELAAFFAYRGEIQPELHDKDGKLLAEGKRPRKFHAFDRLIFGAVRVRTDGKRVLVAVESASANIKEAYVFHVDPGGNVTAGDFTLL